MATLQWIRIVRSITYSGSALLTPFLTKTQIIILGLTTAILYYAYRTIRKKQSYWKDVGIEFANPTFLVGNIAFLFNKKPFLEQLQDMYNQFPNSRYFGIYQGLSPTLMIRDPELIRKIMIKEFDSFHDHRQFVNSEVDEMWGRNLVATTGVKWRDLRTTLSPSFTSSKMRVMFSLMEDCSNQFVDYIRKNVDKDLEMKGLLARYTNDIIASTAFGLKIDSLEQQDNDFYLSGKKATKFGPRASIVFMVNTLSPTLCKLLRLKFIPTSVEKYFYSLIKDTIETRETQRIVRPDMIHLLMEARKGHLKEDETTLPINEGFSSVSEELVHTASNSHKKTELSLDDIVSQALIFFLAGFDTVSTFLNFALYELAINPEIQGKLRKDIRDSADQSNGKITYEALLGLKYLDMVVSESLRLWPPANMTDRIVTKPFTIQPEKSGEKALDLKEGTSCMVSIFALHRDPKFHPEPKKFDPERFNDENRNKIVPGTYLPFGLGPRNCIGSRFALLESKLLLFNILKEFEVVPVERTHIPMILDKKQTNIIADKGMWLAFRKVP